jgi:biotin operon repressor
MAMNRKGVPAMRKDPFARTVMALLQPRTVRGGWIRVEDLAREVGVSKSTIRRQLDVLEAHGFPIEHHVDSGVPRRLALGIRSLLQGKRIDPDPNPDRLVDRDSLKAPPGGRTGAAHPWRASRALDLKAA